MQSAKSQLAVGISILVMSTACYFSIMNSPPLPSGGTDPGPAFLPLILIGFLAIGGLAQLTSGAVRLVRSSTAPPMDLGISSERGKGFFSVVLPGTVAVLMVGYYFLFRQVGYLIPTLLFAVIAVPLADLAIEQRRRPIRQLFRYMVEGALLALAVYGLFHYGIRVPLP